MIVSWKSYSDHRTGIHSSSEQLRMTYVKERFTLDQSTKDLLQSMTPNFGYDGFGEFIFYRTYSRNKTDGSKENWNDVVIRVTEGVGSIRKDWYLKNRIEWDEGFWQHYMLHFAVSMFNMEWLPPGRGLWAMGTDFIYERGSMALYNCFSGSTQFFDGLELKTFEEAVNTTVSVKCVDGKYRPAKVLQFGERDLTRITFKKQGISNFKLTYDCTRNHTWILEDGRRTDYIRVGDKVRIYSNKNSVDKKSQNYKDGFTHGLVFGDGTQQTNNPERYTIRLCSTRDYDYLNLLLGCSDYQCICSPPSYNGDVVLTFVNYAKNYKALPTSTDLTYLRAFLAGWIQADGSNRLENSVRLHTTNREGYEWVVNYAPLLGYTVTGYNENNKPTNYGERNYPLITITLCKDSTTYTVQSIKELNIKEPVYCVSEPETNSFMLAGGLVTGNCCWTNLTDDLDEDIAWMMDCLMCGAGVGFGPERNNQLQAYQPKNSYIYSIPDSREGWCESVKLLISSYLTPNLAKPDFVYDNIREAGLLIRGFGGLSSGPEPLKVLHNQIDTFFSNYIKDPIQYDSVRLKTDIANAVGCCVVAGNVRRSAEICCAPIGDQTFLDLKNYDKNPERASIGWMSNNSAVLSQPDDFLLMNDIARRVVSNGEPGIINHCNLKHGRIGKNDDVREDLAIGFNPCTSGDTLVLTPQGVRIFDKIDIGSTIWSEYGWTKVVNKWSSGIKKVYKYRTTAGYFLGTANHRIVSEGLKVEVQYADTIDILSGDYRGKTEIDRDAIMDGLVIGDGTTQHDQVLLCIGSKDNDYFKSEVSSYILGAYGKTDTHRVITSIKDLPRTYLRKIPKEYLYGNYTKVVNFLRGLYSANGCITANRVQLKAASFDVISDVQTMLSSIGIRSYYTTNKTHENTFANGTYEIKESYDLNISVDRWKFAEAIGFIQDYKTAALKESLKTEPTGKSKETYPIISVEYMGEMETFDITVNNFTHTYWTAGCNVSNCGEIPLEHREVCNIAESLPTRCSNYKIWLKACEYATMYMSTVSLLPTHQASTNSVVARNRRIGLGIVDFTGWVKENGLSRCINWMRQGYKRVRATNKWVNDEAGVPVAIRVTTMKPGGTVPKLAGKTSGLTYPTFKYTLRRVRVAENSPVTPILINANVPYEKDVVSAGTLVFEFPIIQGPSKPIEEASLWEQAFNLVTLQREWSDNAVSNTLTFKPKWYLRKHYFAMPEAGELNRHDEIIVTGLVHALETEYVDDKLKIDIEYHNDNPTSIKIYDYNPYHEEDEIENVLSSITPLIKSVSMLPHTKDGVYAQMPESGITYDEYLTRRNAIKTINWSELKDSDVDTEADKYCSGGVCVRPNL